MRVETLNVKGGPDTYKYMTDDEIISHYFNYKQIGNYSGLKYFQWQEDNKAWLEPSGIIFRYRFYWQLQ